MPSELEGDDPDYDLPEKEKDRIEKRLRAEAKKLLGKDKKKERTKKLNKANEISRRKSKKAHQGAD